MKENFTSINVILDRSSSMSNLTDETIAGFNKFVREQKEVPGDAIFTLATFASDYTLVHDCIPLKEVPELDRNTYRTNGCTALLDAVAKTINSTGAKLAAMKEEDRPSKVIFMLMTDGHENESKEFTYQKVSEMINHQTSKYSWSFVYIGADLNAAKSAQSFGIAKDAAYSYNATSRGTDQLYATMSSGMSNYRRAKVGASFNMINPIDLDDSKISDLQNDLTQVAKSTDSQNK